MPRTRRWFYNPDMTQARFIPALLLAGALSATGTVLAQTTPASTKPDAAGAALEERRGDQRIERIRIDEAGSRIEELRVGGETRSITVSPKGNMPPYEVIPASANRAPSSGERNSNSASGGTRVWKIFGF